MSKKIKKLHNLNAGFTILELVVSLSIFVIISTLVLANYSTYIGKLSVDNLAHEIAISIRQAQVFGQNVREFGVGSGQFPSYGIHFDSTNEDSFVLFADVNSNRKYDGNDCTSLGTECIERFIIQSGARITDLCGDLNCGLLELDITFTRPNPEAYILGNGSGASYGTSDIVISTVKGETRKIVVWLVGQITVE